MEFGRRPLIDSAPILVFENGKMIEGHGSPNTLEDLLKLNSSL